MTEEDVIKRRLIFDGDGTGEDRRLNVLLRMIAKWINTSDETEDESRGMYDKILGQLDLVKHARHRSELVAKTNEEQLSKYKSLYTEMEKNIKTKKKEIENQRQELENAKIVKQNRIQYDLLAKAIAKEPPRTEMNKKLKSLQKELADLAAEKKHLEQVIETRKKQFHVLSTSSNALREMLNADEKIQTEAQSSDIEIIDATSDGAKSSQDEPELMSE